VEVWPDMLHEVHWMVDKNERWLLHVVFSDVMWLDKMCIPLHIACYVLLALVQACLDAIGSKDAYGMLPLHHVFMEMQTK